MSERRVHEERARYGHSDLPEGDAEAAASRRDSIRFETALYEPGWTPVPNLVLFDDRLSVHARLLYAVICHYGWKRDRAFPTMTTLEDVLRISEPTIRNAMRELVDSGLIAVQRRGQGKSNLCTVLSGEKYTAERKKAWVKNERIFRSKAEPVFAKEERLQEELPEEEKTYPRTSVEPPHTGDEPARVSRGGAEQRIAEAWASAFGRPPAPAELAGLRRWLRQDPAFRETPSSQLADLFSVTKHETRARDDAVAVARARFRDGPASWHRPPPRAEGWAVPEVTVPESALAAMRRASPGVYE